MRLFRWFSNTVRFHWLSHGSQTYKVSNDIFSSLQKPVTFAVSAKMSVHLLLWQFAFLVFSFQGWKERYFALRTISKFITRLSVVLHPSLRSAFGLAIVANDLDKYFPGKKKCSIRCWFSWSWSPWAGLQREWKAWNSGEDSSIVVQVKNCELEEYSRKININWIPFKWAATLYLQIIISTSTFGVRKRKFSANKTVNGNRGTKGITKKPEKLGNYPMNSFLKSRIFWFSWFFWFHGFRIALKTVYGNWGTKGMRKVWKLVHRLIHF